MLNLTLNEEENVKLLAGTGELTITENEHLLGQGPSNNLLIHILEHITVNANGDVTVVNIDIKAECTNG